MKKPGCNNTRWMRGRLEINKNCAMYRDIEEIKETNAVQYDIVSWSQYVTGFRGIAMGFDIRIKRTNSKYKEERSISAAFESRDWCTAYSLPPFRRSSFPLFFFSCLFCSLFFFLSMLFTLTVFILSQHIIACEQWAVRLYCTSKEMFFGPLCIAYGRHVRKPM